MSVSHPPQNFHSECESGINRHINMRRFASYTFQSMALYFDRDDVALPGFSQHFKKCSDEEYEHAYELMKYQNKRGGRIVLQDIKKPNRDEWGNGLDAMRAALKLEKEVNMATLELHKTSDKHGDAQMMDFIERDFMKDHVNRIKKYADDISTLKSAGAGLGEYMFDKDFQN